MSETTRRIVDITLEKRGVVRHSAQVEHERKAAIYDLIEENLFDVPGQTGPFHLRLSIEENRLVFDVRDTEDAALDRFSLAIAPFRSLIKQYFMVCETYYSAIKTQTVRQIEAIDMGRRGLHNEGSELLIARLKGKVELDMDTARRLFTLICVLHIRS